MTTASLSSYSAKIIDLYHGNPQNLFLTDVRFGIFENDKMLFTFKTYASMINASVSFSNAKRLNNADKIIKSTITDFQFLPFRFGLKNYGLINTLSEIIVINLTDKCLIKSYNFTSLPYFSGNIDIKDNTLTSHFISDMFIPLFQINKIKSKKEKNKYKTTLAKENVASLCISDKNIKNYDLILFSDKVFFQLTNKYFDQATMPIYFGYLDLKDLVTKKSPTFIIFDEKRASATLYAHMTKLDYKTSILADLKPDCVHIFTNFKKNQLIQLKTLRLDTSLHDSLMLEYNQTKRQYKNLERQLMIYFQYKYILQNDLNYYENIQNYMSNNAALQILSMRDNKYILYFIIKDILNHKNEPKNLYMLNLLPYLNDSDFSQISSMNENELLNYLKYENIQQYIKITYDKIELKFLKDLFNNLHEDIKYYIKYNTDRNNNMILLNHTLKKLIDKDGKYF